MNSFVQPCVCSMQHCHGKENSQSISPILSCEDAAEYEAESDKSVSVFSHDAYTFARFIGTSHSNIIYNNEYITVNC